MLPSLCMDITDSDESGVAWHRLDSPRKPEAYIRPFHVSERATPGRWGEAETRSVYLEAKGIDTQCAGADTGQATDKRDGMKRAVVMLRHQRAIQARFDFEVGGASEQSGGEVGR